MGSTYTFSNSTFISIFIVKQRRFTKSNGTTVAPRNSAAARVVTADLDLHSGRVTSVDIFEGGKCSYRDNRFRFR